MIWLYKEDAQVWHLWQGRVFPVPDQQHAWCGLPKDDTCVRAGDPSVITKCQTCLKNAASLPSPP